MLITRKVEFSASHVCRNPAAFRRARTGNCYGAEANPHGHGHNYVVEVSLEGEPDPVTGMVMDLKELKEILQREVLDVYDHRFLNYEVPPFDRVVPTAENIAIDIWRRLEPQLVRTARPPARRAGLRDAGPLRGVLRRRRVIRADAPLPLLAPRTACTRPRSPRGGEPQPVREVQQPVRPRPQLRGGGERAGPARRAQPGARWTWRALDGWCGARGARAASTTAT